jgi:hypothetical protein
MADRDDEVRIDINADVSGLKSGTQEAAAQIDRLNAAVNKGSAALAAANRQSDEFVSSLRRQVDTYGMTRGEVASYDAQLRGLTGTHLDSVRALGQQLDALDANEKMLTRVKVAAAAAGAAIGLFLVAAGRQMLAEVMEVEQSGARLEAVYRATGGAAKLALGDIRALGEELARSTLFDQEEIQDAASMMLTFKNVQGDTFRQAMRMSADLAATFNTDLKSAVLQLGKALEDPENGLTALRRSGVSFSDAQKDMIKALVETGRQAEAMTMILDTMRAQGLDGVAASMKHGVTKEANDLGKAWDDLLESIGKTELVGGWTERFMSRMSLWLTDMKNVIEQGDWADKLAFFITGGGWKTDDVRAMRSPRQHGASGSWGEPAPIDEAALKAETDARKAAEAAQKKAKAAAEAAARDYASAVSKSKDYLAALQAETAALSMNKDQQDAVRMAREAARAPTAQLRKEIMAAAAANLQERARLAELDAAEKLRAETLKRLAKEQEAATAAARKSAAGVAEEVKRQREATEEYGLSAAALHELGLTRLDAAIAAEEQLAAERVLAGAAVDEIEAIWDKIDALNELKKAREAHYDKKAGVDAETAAGEAAKKAAADAEAEWKRTSDSIESSLTDALMRGFESGKDFAANLGDATKNLFKSLVLRPIVQPIAQMGSNMVMGMLGMGGSGSAMAAGSSAVGSSIGSSIGTSAIGTAIGAGVGDMIGLGANLFGGAEGIGVIAGGIGEMFGMSSAAAGAMGAGVAGSAIGMIGAAIPWIGALALLGSALGIFGGKPSNKAAGGLVDLGTGATSGLWQMTGDKAPSQETLDGRNALLASIGGYGGALTALGATSLPYQSVGVDVGERDGIQFRFDGGANGGTFYGNDADTALTKLFREMAAGAEGLDESVQSLLEHFSGTAEQFGNFTASLVSLQDYMAADPLTAAAEAAEAAGRSAWQVWQDQGADLRAALTAWDGSAAATAELASLTQSRYQTELALAQQINAALASTSTMFDSAAEEMRYSTLDQAGQYEFLRTKSAELEEALKAAFDPSEIMQLEQEILETSKSAWQLLGAEERKIKIDEYEQYLDEIEQLGTERLNAAGAALTAERDESLPDSIVAAIETAMDRVAAQFMAAAQAQQAAADTPVRVEGTATVVVEGAGVSGMTEVNLA